MQNKNQKAQPNYKTILDIKDQSKFGYLAIGAFLFFWLVSCLSPIIVIIMISKGYYLTSILYSMAFMIGYLPIPVSKTFRKYYALYSAKYFKHTTISVEDGCHIIENTKPTMVAIHPHGIFCLSWNTLYSRPEFAKVQMCFSAMLNQGFFRMISKLVGQPSSVDKNTMVRHMKKGVSVGLIPGGFEEASFHVKGKEQTFLKERAGFIKLALQFGYSVTPVYGFKECNSYWNIQGFKSIKLLLNKYKLPGILPFGNPLFPIMPKRDCEIHVVLGKSLDLPKIENPTKEDVQKYHQLYTQELIALFNRHKGRFYETEIDLTLL